MVGQPNKASTSDTVSTLRVEKPVSTTTAPSRNGNPRKTSISLANKESGQPAYIPEMQPTTIAATRARAVDSNPTVSDALAPYITLAYTSQPCTSKPKGCPVV